MRKMNILFNILSLLFMKRSIASLGLVVTVFSNVPFAIAQDAQRPVSPPSQITIGNDIYMAGEHVSITAPVNGNLNIAAGGITIGTTVAGDLQVMGGDIAIHGGIRDNVRVLGGDVRITGRVNGSLTVVAGQVLIEKTAVIGAGLLVTGGQVVIDGTVNGTLKAKAGDVTVNGTINGISDIRSDTATINGIMTGTSTVVANTFVIGETAMFRGNLNYWSGQGQQNLTGRVTGTAAFKADLAPMHDDARHDKGMFFGLLGAITIYSLFSAALTIGLLMFLTKNFFVNAAKYLHKQQWMSLLIGFLYFILTPILALILAVTVIGIPLAIAVLLSYVVAMFFSSALTSMVLARWVETKYRKKWHPVTVFFLTLGIFIGLKILLIIPFLGWILNAVLVCMGIGSLIAMKHAVYMKAR